MRVAPLPLNELERLKAINDYFVLETLSNKTFLDISCIASEICNTPSSLFCIVDSSRQWIKCSSSIITTEIVKEFSFFSNTISEEVLFASNTLKDKRFNTNRYVIGAPNFMFFVQIPLFSPQKKAIGAICIFDTEPKELTKSQVASLTSLADQVVHLLNLSKEISVLKQKQIEQKNAYADLEKFSHVASHDLRSPLNNIISLTQLLKDEYSSKMDEDGKEYLKFLNNAANQLADLVSGILEYSRSSQILVDAKEKVNVTELIEEIIRLLHLPVFVKIDYPKNSLFLSTSRIALKQILLNLCDNAIRHNDKQECHIDITVKESKKYFTFDVSDNGPGIHPDDQKRIFELFERVKKKDNSKEGSGVGLAIVKRLIEKLGGELKVISEINTGTSFQFSIPK